MGVSMVDAASHSGRFLLRGVHRANKEIRRMSTQGKIRADLASFPGGRSRSCGIVGMPNVGKVRKQNATRGLPLICQSDGNLYIGGGSRACIRLSWLL